MNVDSDRRWLENAILVYGPRKAGTTLFQNLLDGSNELMVYPAELKLKKFVRYRWGEPRDQDRYFSSSRIGSIRSVRLSQEKYASHWRDYVRQPGENPLASLIRHDVLAVLAAADGAASHPVSWVAKEVGGQSSRRVISLWRELFPRGRVILLLRDPSMTTRAVLNDRRRKGVRLSIPAIVHQTIEPLRILRAQSALMGERWALALCYEDVVTRTAAVMKSVAGFIGVPYSSVFERPTLFGDDIVVRTSSRNTTGIFQPEHDWRQGLTRREQLVVSATKAVARLVPGLRLEYDRLAEKALLTNRNR